MRSGCPPKPWRRRTRFGGFRRRHKKDHGCKAVGLHCDQDLRSGERCTTSSDWTFSQLVAHQGLRHRPGLALQESVGDCKCQSWAAPPPFHLPWDLHALRKSECPRFSRRRGAQGHEELSLLPERAPSEGPRSTAAVKSASRPRLAGY